MKKEHLWTTASADCWKFSTVVHIFKNVGKGVRLKTITLLIFFMWLAKSLKKIVNNRLVDHLEEYDLFTISSMVLGLFNERQFF